MSRGKCKKFCDRAGINKGNFVFVCPHGIFTQSKRAFRRQVVWRLDLTRVTQPICISFIGTKWAKWSQLENTIRHDYKGLRDTPKPGNDILPPFGYCDIYESSKDITLTHGNKHTVLCELSQNVLYQYCFVLIWFTIVAGIIVSCIGLVLQIAEHLITVTCVLRHGNIAQKMYKVLTLRECEYLEFIRRRDIPLYGALIVKLREEKFGHLKKSNGNGNLPYNETPPPGFNEAMSCI